MGKPKTPRGKQVVMENEKGEGTKMADMQPPQKTLDASLDKLLLDPLDPGPGATSSGTSSEMTNSKTTLDYSSDNLTDESNPTTKEMEFDLGDPPVGVDTKLWALLLQINNNVKLGSSEIDSTKVRTKKIEEDQENLKSKVEQLERDKNEKDLHIKLLYSKISSLEKQMNRQSEMHSDLAIRSMDHNIVITGKNKYLQESKDDDCLNIVLNVLAKEARVPRDQFNIVRAHRMGQFEHGRNRPIVARLGSREQVSEVLKHGKNLAGSDIYINQQYPPIVGERRQFCQQFRKKAKDNGAAAVRLTKDKLYVNNELQRHLLAPKLPASTPDIAALTTPVVSPTKTTDSCRMQIFLFNAKSMDDLRPNLDSAAIISPQVADTTVYAYRFTDSNGIKRNFDSGDEHGAGSQLLGLMDQYKLDNKMAVMYVWRKTFNDTAKGKGFYQNMKFAIDEMLG